MFVLAAAVTGWTVVLTVQWLAAINSPAVLSLPLSVHQVNTKQLRCMELSDTDYFEDAQHVSTVSAESCLDPEGPAPKRQCASMTPPLFSSPSELDIEDHDVSSEGAVFPSEASLSSSTTYVVYFPSEENENESKATGCCTSVNATTTCTLHHDNEESSSTDFSDAENTPQAHSRTVVTLASNDSDEERERVGNILVSKCCQNDCLLHLTAHDVLTARRKFFSLRGNEQRQWLVDKIHESSHEEEKGKLLVKFTFAGHDVCQKSWCHIYMISHRRLTRIVKSVSKGNIVAEHGNRGKRRLNTKSESAKAWMTRYFNLVGDRMPHKSQIHLPCWETQKDIYRRHIEDMTLQQIPNTEMVSLSMFYKIWSDDFSHVVIPEVRRMCVV